MNPISNRTGDRGIPAKRVGKGFVRGDKDGQKRKRNKVLEKVEDRAVVGRRD